MEYDEGLSGGRAGESERQGSAGFDVGEANEAGCSLSVLFVWAVPVVLLLGVLVRAVSMALSVAVALSGSVVCCCVG